MGNVLNRRKKIEYIIDDLVDNNFNKDQNMKEFLKETAAHESHFGEIADNFMQVDDVQQEEMKKRKYQSQLGYLGARRKPDGSFDMKDDKTKIILGAMKYLTTVDDKFPDNSDDRYDVWKEHYNTDAENAKGDKESWVESLNKFGIYKPKEKKKEITGDMSLLNPLTLFGTDAEASEIPKRQIVSDMGILQQFDPESSGYDYATARESGGKPDETGHWGSLDPRTGMVLKGRGHETWDKMEQEETVLGNEIVNREGRYYSQKKIQKRPITGDMGILDKKQDDENLKTMIQTSERDEFNYVQYGGLVDPDMVANWREMGKIGYPQMARETPLTKGIPFVGTGVDVVGLVKLKRTVDRLKVDNYGGDTGQKSRDMIKLQEYLFKTAEKEARGTTIGGQIYGGVAELPSFLGEFLMTGGAAALGKQAVAKGAKAAIRKGVKGAVAKTAMRGAGWVAGAGARTVAMPHRVAKQYLERRVQKELGDQFKVTDKGVKTLQEAEEKPFTSFMKAYGDVLIENMSEVAGQGISKVGKKFVPKGMGRAFQKFASKYIPKNKMSELWTKAGYHGILEEIGEERLGDFMRGVTGVTGEGNVFERVVQSVPDGEQMLVEFGVFVVPGAMQVATTGAAQARADRKKLEFYKRALPMILTEETMEEIKEENFDDSEDLENWLEEKDVFNRPMPEFDVPLHPAKEGRQTAEELGLGPKMTDAEGKDIPIEIGQPSEETLEKAKEAILPEKQVLKEIVSEWSNARKEKREPILPEGYEINMPSEKPSSEKVFDGHSWKVLHIEDDPNLEEGMMRVYETIRPPIYKDDKIVSHGEIIAAKGTKKVQEPTQPEGDVKLYHGIGEETTTDYPIGKYYAESEDIAKEFGDKIEKTTIDKSKILDVTEIETVGELLDRVGGYLDINPYSSVQRDTTIKHLGSQWNVLEQMMRGTDAIEKLREQGFQAIRFIDKTGGKKHPSVVTFHPTQPEGEPLIAEAKKYKTAEEFVESFKSGFRGRGKEFGEPLTPNEATGASYFSVDESVAGDYGETVKAHLKSKNMAYFGDRSELIDDYIQKTMPEKMENWIEYANNYMGMPEEAFLSYLKKDTKGAINPYDEADKILIPYLKKQGFDSLEFSDQTMETTEYVIFDPKNAFTKQQLTDIWNKAQGEGEVGKERTRLLKQEDEEMRVEPSAKELLKKAAAQKEIKKETSEKFEENKESLPIEISKDDIPYNIAYQAHQGTSMSPEKRAETTQQDYLYTMQDFYDGLKDIAKTDAQKAILKSEMESFKEGYIKRELAVLSAKSRTMSSMVVGPANFPVARNKKRLNAEQARTEELLEFIKKAKTRARKRINKQEIEDRGGEYEVAKQELAKEEKNLQLMKDVNKLLRKKGISKERKIQEIIKMSGWKESTVEKLFEPDYSGRQGFPSFELTNKNARIKRLKEKIGSMEKADTLSGEEVIVERNGIKVVNNFDEQRVQMLFDEKPSDELRSKLKSSGWRWSPRNGAWQRQNTSNAINNAKQFVRENFGSGESYIASSGGYTGKVKDSGGTTGSVKTQREETKKEPYKGGYGTIESSEKAVQNREKQKVAKTDYSKVSEELPENSGVIDEALKIISPASREGTGIAKKILRSNVSQLAHKDVVAVEALKKAHRAFTWMSDADSLDFIDRMERGAEQKTPELQKFSEMFRDLLDSRREEVRQIGKGHLENFIENYFPHIWKDPKKAKNIIMSIMGKKRLEGSKSFLKQRVIVSTKDGVERGLEPVSYNPVDLVLLKIHEMDRYIMAQDIIRDLKDRRLIKFVYSRSKTPEGYKKINDNAFTVFMPPEITKNDYYDKMLVDQMMDVALSLGVDTKRFVNIGGGRLGYAQWYPGQKGGEKVRTKMASPESTLAHEIGHILGYRYDLYNLLGRRMEGERKVHKKGKKAGQSYFKPTKEAVEYRRDIDAQWRALADARGHKPEYARKAREKEAVLLEAMIHAPNVFEEVAPDLFREFTKFLNNQSELRPLLDIKPSLVKGANAAKIAVPGFTTLGSFMAPEPVALLLNNYLSPGIRNNDNKLISGGYNMLRGAGNILNQAQLAFSLFHGLNVTSDMAISTFGLGLRRLNTKGQRWKGLSDIIGVPLSPITTVWNGIRIKKAYTQQIDQITDPKLQTMIKAIIAAGGRDRMDVFYYNQQLKALEKTFVDIVKGDVLTKAKGVAKLPFNLFGSLFEVAAKPLMEWYVPTGKMGLFAKLAQHEMERAESGQINQDQLWERLTSVWDSVDNRMGQLVYDNLFWNKTLKDAAMLSVRSVGWNLGSWREFGGSFVDTARTRQRIEEGDLWLSHKMAYTISAVTIYSILGATIQYLLTGEPPEEPKDYLFPKTGNKNPDGSDERLSLPTYAKDWWAWSHRPIQTATHKLHPLWGTLGDLATNKDFFDTEIRHGGDPFLQQGIDFISHIGENFKSISRKNYEKMQKTAPEQRLRNAMVSITGITSAPSYITKSPAQKLMTRLIVDKIPRGARTKEQFERSQYRKVLKTMLRKGMEIDEKEAIEILGFRSYSSLLREARMDPFSDSFNRLSFRDALSVYTIATPEERSQSKNILRGKFSRAKKFTTEEKELYFELMK